MFRTLIGSGLRAFAPAALLIAFALPGHAAGDGKRPDRQDWTFAGIFGTYDNAQLQRGFQVWREACSSCHTLDIPFRALGQTGGPEFTPEQVEALAAEFRVPDIDASGAVIERPAKPADRIPSPYPNKETAIASFGAYPPEMSVLAKARGYKVGFPQWIFDMLPGFTYQEHGADYIYSLVARGYVEPPAEKVIAAGQYYNLYMPGNIIAMPQPIADGQVTYARVRPDGTLTTNPEEGELPPGVTETVDQYTRDVVAFLYWSAEPHLEERKRMGFQVLLFLAVFLGLLYYTKKKVWAAAH
jgi:cytochrome c1